MEIHIGRTSVVVVRPRVGLLRLGQRLLSVHDQMAPRSSGGGTNHRWELQPWDPGSTHHWFFLGVEGLQEMAPGFLEIFPAWFTGDVMLPLMEVYKP